MILLPGWGASRSRGADCRVGRKQLQDERKQEAGAELNRHQKTQFLKQKMTENKTGARIITETEKDRE